MGRFTRYWAATIALPLIVCACSKEEPVTPSEASDAGLAEAGTRDAQTGDANPNADATPFVPHAPAGHLATPLVCPSHADAGVTDTCTTAADCGPGKGCLCGEYGHPGGIVLPNACVAAACLVDSDCGPAGYCSISLSCAGGLSGFYCHTPSDTCSDGYDCSVCAFHGTAWQCEPCAF